MSEASIAQAEADALIAMPKVKVNDDSWSLPITGGGIVIPLVSSNKRENFCLDISRGRVDLLKGKYQNRARQNIILVRLDYGSKPHRNPDDQEISCPHLHIYREEFGDKWATPVPAGNFSNPSDRWKMLQDFMKFCNIVEPPRIEKGLFS